MLSLPDCGNEASAVLSMLSCNALLCLPFTVTACMMHDTCCSAIALHRAALPCIALHFIALLCVCSIANAEGDWLNSTAIAAMFSRLNELKGLCMVPHAFFEHVNHMHSWHAESTTCPLVPSSIKPPVLYCLSATSHLPYVACLLATGIKPPALCSLSVAFQHQTITPTTLTTHGAGHL